MIAESRLPKFNDALDLMRAHLDRVRRLMQAIPGRNFDTLAEHERLVEAIASGDPAKARQGLRAHLENATKHIMTVAKISHASPAMTSR
jgi:DNA-binding FadR family transcriptional regulator